MALVAGLLTFTTTPTVNAQSPGAWKPLFNGKDLTGWTVLAGGGRATCWRRPRTSAGNAARRPVDEPGRAGMEG